MGIKKLLYLLLVQELIDLFSSREFTPLLIATQNGHASIVRLLLANKTEKTNLLMVTVTQAPHK